MVIFDKKYPTSKSDVVSKPFYNSWGLPDRDFDGTAIKTGKNPSKKLFDVDIAARKEVFREIATLYGADEALQMTRALPSILAFDSKNFEPSLTAFTEIFGEEESKAMVMRNPGLLYVKPESAATSDDLTMQFSYIIALTRPAGPFLLYGTLSLLTVPIIEGITGVSKAEFFKSIGLLSFLF